MSIKDLLLKAKKGLAGSKVYFVAAEFFNLAILTLGITYLVKNGTSNEEFLTIFIFAIIAFILVTIFGMLTRFFIDDSHYNQWPFIIFLISSIIFSGVSIAMSATIGEVVGIVLTIIVAIYDILLGIFSIVKEEMENV